MWLGVRSWPRLCENARALFLGVNFSHVDAISGDLLLPIRLLLVLRGERNEFSHSLGQETTVAATPYVSQKQSSVRYAGPRRLPTYVQDENAAGGRRSRSEQVEVIKY